MVGGRLDARCGIWLWATTGNVELFSVELDAFAHQVGAGPTKQIVLVLDGAGWAAWACQYPDAGTEHLHLLFLLPHCPELQPAEHLWPLTNTVLANQHFVSIEELKDAQAERCIGSADPCSFPTPAPCLHRRRVRFR